MSEPTSENMSSATTQESPGSLEARIAELETKVLLLESQVERERARADAAERDAATDTLTGLFSRRVITELITAELKNLDREGGRMAIVSFDLDHFKSINDTYGHQQGDQVLINFANAIKKGMRGTDVISRTTDDQPNDEINQTNTNESIGRVGGEEFVLMLPLTAETSDADIQKILTRYMEAIQKVNRSNTEGEFTPLTASIGCAIVSSNLPLETVLEAADKAMYTSKEAGRNQATITILDEEQNNVITTVKGPSSK